MKVKDLKKDTHKSVRINSDVLQIITDRGYTLQSFLDEQLEKFIDIEIKDAQLTSEV